MHYQNAAVLPYNTYIDQGHQKKTYYFAQERSGKLSTFGGTKKSVDNNHPTLTAAREFKEESHIWNGHHVRKRISTGEIVKNNSAITFIAEMPNIGNPHTLYSKFKHSRKFNSLPANQREVQQIVNVSRRELTEAIDHNTNPGQLYIKGIKVRKCVAKTLIQARNERKL